MTKPAAADHHHGLAPGQKPHESPWVVTLPLILLAIPSVFIGYFTIEPLLFGDFFKDAIYISKTIPAWTNWPSRISRLVGEGLARSGVNSRFGSLCRVS